jgi:acetate kinase
LELILAQLIDPERGCLGDLTEVAALGHRVVHGGRRYTRPTLVDQGVLAGLARLVELAPLHLPPALACLEACQSLLPHVPQVALFDTMFHQTMPPETRFYPVPPQWAADFGVQRYGFHGLSHQYAVQEAARLLDRDAHDLRLVTAHLGNGVSLAAWQKGRVLDTTMGFTPLEGVMMGTRPGSLDPACVPYLAAKLEVSAAEVISRLNHDCGLWGVSGLSRDLRVIEEAAEQGHEGARLAWAMFVHRLGLALGGYLFSLGGAEALVLTGGIGENSWRLRQALLEGRGQLGLDLDHAANRAMVGGREGFISQAASPVKVLVIAAGEELMMARATHSLLSA